MSDPGRTILVVDDEKTVRDLIRWILEEAGFTVLEAGDGDEALEVFRSSGADLVLTDLVMPDREGIETITELRRIDRSARIIAMSGAIDSDTYLKLAGTLGAVCTLNKPFRRDELLAAIDAALTD
jgi:DNA-binding response OmpR family regulator